MDASGYGSNMELFHGACAPSNYHQQQAQQMQQRPRQLGMAMPVRYAMAAPPLRGGSPVSEDDDLSSCSPAPTYCGHSPGAWSSQTDSSGYSSPPSDASGANEWDLLSDMLMEDALAGTMPAPAHAPGSVPVPATAASSAYAVSFTKQMHESAYMPIAAPASQQQQQQQHMLAQRHEHAVTLANASMLPAATGGRAKVAVAPHPLARSGQAMAPPALIAAVAPSPMVPSPVVAAAVAAADAFASLPSLSAMQATANIISPAQRTRVTKAAAAPVVVPSDDAVGAGATLAVIAASTTATTTAAATAAAAVVKVEPVSTEEQKKLRRRTQIASSVQRHREKKKTLVSSLKHELASLTSQLESMRSQRKFLHANDELVEWEERAITQRRKRKQSEEVNARMKKALFQQTAFLFGMRAMMSDLPAPRELEFHDWIHSYTVLSARDASARRREYTSYFSESKMDLAAKIVLRATEAPMLQLNSSRPYYANVQLLHDGTRAFADEATVPVAHELTRTCYDVGNGQVMKKYTSVFLFDDPTTTTTGGDSGMSFETVHNVAWECTKQVGVFWPGAGYMSQSLDVVDVSTGGGISGSGTSSSSRGDSRVYFTDLSADLELLDDVREGAKITVESRMLCREQRLENESIFVWDYVDRDDLYPLPLGADALAKRTITRKSCGAVVVRKESSGFISIRSTSVKIFDTTLPASTEQQQQDAAASSSDAETIATMNRRLGLQATEAERKQQKCIRYVYDAMREALAAASASDRSK